MKKAYLFGGAAVVAVGVGLTAGLLLREEGGPFAPCRDNVIAGGGSTIGGDFTLVSETGETVTSDDVIDGPTLIYFGYTFCPDVCPYDSARNAEVVDLLDARGYDVTPVFITIDPARDTPEVLAEYTDYLHPDMLGLTGSAEQVDAAARAYRAYYGRGPDVGEDGYLMNHSVFSYLVLPEHGFVEFYRGAPGVAGEGIESDAMAESMECYLSRA